MPLTSLSYESRLKAIGLTTSTERRQRADKIQLFMIMNGVDNILTEANACQLSNYLF